MLVVAVSMPVLAEEFEYDTYFEEGGIRYDVLFDDYGANTFHLKTTNKGDSYGGWYVGDPFVVPSYVDHYDTVKKETLHYTVTEIGSGTFYHSGNDDNHMSSVSLPPTLTKIGDYSFAGARYLTSLTIPEGVVEIGDRAFERLEQLTSISLPSTLCSIGASAFMNCSSLSTITIPSEVSVINNFTFWGCSNLETVNLPNGITSIGKEAFYGLSKLETINIPTSLVEVGQGAFMDCIALTSITFPNTFRTVGESAFRGCNGLTSVVFNEGATTIRNTAFRNCHSLASVTFSSTITTIEDGAFEDCALTSIILPDGLNTLGDNAFSSNSTLTSANLPVGIETLGNGVFVGCGFTSFIVPEGITTIPDYFFSRCKSLAEVSLPQSLRTIGYWAFGDGCPLRTLTIPENVETINGTFTYLSKVYTLIMKGTTPPIFTQDPLGWWADTPGKVVVPTGSLATYRAAEVWGHKNDNNEYDKVKNIVEPREDEVTLTDGTTYDNEYDIEVDELEYSRVYKNTNWQAWYVPFEMTITGEMLSHFSFGKFAGTYTDDDDFFLTLAYLREGDKMKPHTPYFIKAKVSDSYNPQSITIENVTLKAAKEVGFIMLSAEKKITIQGIYSEKEATQDDCDWYAYAGGLYRHPTPGAILSPYRFFMTIEDREDNPYFSTPSPSEVKMLVIGDGETSIEEIDMEMFSDASAVYDLSGYRMNEKNMKRGIFIVNGKKIFVR